MGVPPMIDRFSTLLPCLLGKEVRNASKQETHVQVYVWAALTPIGDHSYQTMSFEGVALQGKFILKAAPGGAPVAPLPR